MVLVPNKKARAEYAISSTVTAGIVLSGQEVKSLRLKQGSLKGSYVKLVGGELFLINAHISPYKFSDPRKDYDPTRTRKLLLSKREITDLQAQQEQKKVVLVPLSIDAVGRYIKVQVGIGKGLKKFEKRERIKKRDLEREIAREMKYR
ncbi:MAG: SsrA-binding protein SmpB [Pseudomonadales bacterium]|nr:SsrA-binding protein SmpB [Candidatus Woesebacteria bacterium]MCB9800993.1 SsrA-binding protein SmpB [Pseudomonadales bacterium]